MGGYSHKEGKVVRTIKTHNDVHDGTAITKKGSGIRMALFYTVCVVCLIFASYGGLLVEKSTLKDAILQNNAELMNKAINLKKVNDGIVSQMPGILDEVKKDPNDEYANSMNVDLDRPDLYITPDNLVDTLIKGGFVKKTADGYAFSDLEWHTVHWAFSHVSVVVTNRENPEDVLTLQVAKEGSILVWRVTGAYMSIPLRDRVLKQI